MNAEKIVEELRWLSENDEWVFAADTTDEAADLIESLQAQLAKEKRRAERAVNDLNTLRKKSGWKCFACQYDVGYVREICAGCNYNNDDNWEWRGDAEDGDAE